MGNFYTVITRGVAACLMFAGAASAFAADSATLTKDDPMIKGALECTRHFPRYERELGIPTHLLSAIASTESGRFHRGLKISLPWPWTISSGGKGQYFKTKAEAIAAVKKLQAQGVTNIDIGCMQVNMHHHGDAFTSVEQAFEPHNNIAYAAKFLRNLYEENNSWKDAASDYHSRTPSLGRKYVQRVYTSWFGIIEKLREARVSVPNSSIATMQSMNIKNNHMVQLASVASPAKVETLRPATESNVKVYRVPRTKEISVRPAESSITGPAAISYTRPIDRAGVIVLDHQTISANQPAASVSGSQAPVSAVPNVVPVPVNVVPSEVVAPVSRKAAGDSSVAAVAPAVAPPVVSAQVAGDTSQVGLSVSAPLDPIANAALMPVSGVINAALQKGADSFQTPPSQPTPSRISESAPVRIDYAARRVLEASYPERDGPRFIFSE